MGPFAAQTGTDNKWNKKGNLRNEQQKVTKYQIRKKRNEKKNKQPSEK